MDNTEFKKELTEFEKLYNEYRIKYDVSEINDILWGRFPISNELSEKCPNYIMELFNYCEEELPGNYYWNIRELMREIAEKKDISYTLDGYFNGYNTYRSKNQEPLFSYVKPFQRKDGTVVFKKFKRTKYINTSEKNYMINTFNNIIELINHINQFLNKYKCHFNGETKDWIVYEISKGNKHINLIYKYIDDVNRIKHHISNE